MARLSSPITATVALILVALASITNGYSAPRPFQSSSSSKATSQSFSRSTFLSTTTATCLTFLTASQPAFAKDVDPALKGTKKDPEFEGCLSTCIYECTKPKGMEQKSRAECIPECKSKCATTKAQLMKGEPKKD